MSQGSSQGKPTKESVDRALQDITFQVLRLENAAAEVSAVFGDQEPWSNVQWKFDPPHAGSTKPAKVTQTATENAKSAAKARRPKAGTTSLKRSAGDEPCVGSYQPNYDLRHKQAPAFSFSKPPNQAPTQTKAKVKTETQSETSKREGTNVGDCDALSKTSRVRSCNATVFGKSRRDCNAPAPVAEGPGFAYAHQGSMAMKTVACLPPEKMKTKANGRKKGSSSTKRKGPESGDYDTERALHSVEPRVCGVIGWKPVQKAKSASRVDQTELDVEAGQKAVHPRVKGVISWGRPPALNRAVSQRKKALESPGSTAGEHILQASFEFADQDGSNDVPHRHKAAKTHPAEGQMDKKIHFKIREPSMPTTQLLKHRQRKLAEAACVGPGLYDVQTKIKPTRASYMQQLNLGCHKPRANRPTPADRSKFYDIHKADVLTQKRVVGVRDFSKGSARFASDLRVIKRSTSKESASLDRRSKTADRRSEYEEKHASSDDESCMTEASGYSYSASLCSSSSTCSSMDEGKDDSDSSCTSAASSSLSEISSRKARHMLKAWCNMRRTSRRRTSLHSRLEQKHGEGSTSASAWAKPSYEQTLVGRKYLALRQHKRRKQDEAQGPARCYEANDEAVRPSVKGITRYDRSSSRTVPRKPREKPVSKSKEEILFAKLGLTDLLVEDTTQLVSTHLPTEHVPTMLMKKPASPSEQLKRLRELQADEARRLGPGAYEVASQQLDNEQAQRAATLLAGIKSAKATLSKAKTEAERAVASTDLAAAKSAWQDFQQCQPFHKLPGRPKERVDPDNGPGMYSVPQGMTRFGTENVKGVLDFSRTTRDVSQISEEQIDIDGDMLQLDAISLDIVKPSKPGAKGFSFSREARPVSKCNDALNKNDLKECPLNLEPDYTFGKFSEAGKGLVELHKMSGRKKIEVTSEDEPVLDLDPKRADKLIHPRIKGLSFSRMQDRGLAALPSSPREAYHDAAYSPFVDEKVKVLVDYSRGPVRWSTEPSPCDDFVVHGDEAPPSGIAIGAGRTAIDMAKQSERWPKGGGGDSQLPYADSAYDKADTSLLGGLNSKGKPRRGSANTVGFKRQSKRWTEHSESAEMHVDIDTPRAVERARRRTDFGVAMAKQSKRWSDRSAEAAAPSPDATLVEAGRKHITGNDEGQLWIVPMAKTTGRDELFAGNTTNDDANVKTDLLRALDAPSQKPRVLGGVIPQSQRPPLASKNERNPDAPPLNPKDDALRPKQDKGVLDMHRAQGRPENEASKIGPASIEMTEPPKPDIQTALQALRARIPGGDSALKPATGEIDSRPLQARRKARSAEESKQRNRVNDDNAQRRRKIKEERLANLQRASALGEKENKKNRKRRAAAKKAMQEKNWKDEQIGLRVVVRNRMNKKRT